MIELLVLLTPLAVLAASLCVIYIIRFLDVVEREPKRMIGLALLAGAVATIPAIFIQNSLSTSLQAGGMAVELSEAWNLIMIAPISEELVKGFGLLILVIVFRSKFDSLTDFLVYACAVGIGFEFVENILYQWSALSAEQDKLASWIDEFNNRTLASAGGHAFFSIWLGFACWIPFKSKDKKLAALIMPAILISIGLHLINNLSAFLASLGPPDQTLPINRIGVTLGVVSNHLNLALFIAVIGFAILRDLRFLSDYGIWVQAKLMREATLNTSALQRLQSLLNPLNHLLAGSSWSWHFCRDASEGSSSRSDYRAFASLALAAARRSQSDTSENLARSELVARGCALVSTSSS